MIKGKVNYIIKKQFNSLIGKIKIDDIISDIEEFDEAHHSVDESIEDGIEDVVLDQIEDSNTKNSGNESGNESRTERNARVLLTDPETLQNTKILWLGSDVNLIITF